MSRSFIALASIGALLVSVAAYAQTTPAPAPAASTPAAAPAASTAAAPATGAKRTACQTTTAALKGQDKRDQMQLCMAQAHLDCLKQAIDQKITGPQRKDFVKTCAN
jgi:hypothetical protein